MSELREGYTTGTCAAAAAKAAVQLLADAGAVLKRVKISLPDGDAVWLPLAYARSDGCSATAAVQKDAGDDPDVTHGALIEATVAWLDNANGRIEFCAGEGVGTVTKPGLSVPPGEPAITPAPRRMIQTAVREITSRGVRVEIAIPGGKELARKTFNERLGVVGGLSILGNSGRVRPFSHEAIQATVGCALNVAEASGVRNLVLVPGRIGENAARRHFHLTSGQIIEVSNEWGVALQRAGELNFKSMLMVGHPGKLAKLAAGQFQTHSSRSESPVRYLERFGFEVLNRQPPVQCNTTEELMGLLSADERLFLANALAAEIALAAKVKIGRDLCPAVCLVNLRGDILGGSGDLNPWRK